MRMPVSQPDVKWLPANHLPSKFVDKTWVLLEWEVEDTQLLSVFEKKYNDLNFSLEKQAWLTSLLLLTSKKAVANDIVDKKSVNQSKSPKLWRRRTDSLDICAKHWRLFSES